MSLAAVMDENEVMPSSLTRRVWLRFFQLLRDRPFCAVIVHPDRTHRLWIKGGVTPEQLRSMRDTIDEHLREWNGN